MQNILLKLMKTQVEYKLRSIISLTIDVILSVGLFYSLKKLQYNKKKNVQVDLLLLY